jgi:hypothetical protein
MKKQFIKLTVLLLVLVALTALFACDPPVEEGEKSLTIIMLKSDGTADVYSENTDSQYLGEVIDEMLAEGDIILESEDTQYGRKILKIGCLIPGENQWIFIYSDETDPTLVSDEWGTAVYDGKTYKSTTLGLDDMPVYDGRTYVFSIGG